MKKEYSPLSKKYSLKYYKNNLEKCNMASKRYRDKLSDAYVSALLKQSGIKATPELIEKKREYVIKLRQLRSERIK